MARIDIEIDVEDLDPRVADDIRRSLSGAADELAGLAQQRVTEALPVYLDRPTPFTMRGIGTRPSDQDSATPEAVVDVLPVQREYLSYEILGGVRRAGDYATTKLGPLVPGPDAPRDAYGNLPRNFVRMVMRQPGVRWVTLKKGKPPILIRQRPGRKIEILAIIIREARYQPKLPFFDLVDQAVVDNVETVIGRRVSEAVR